MNVITYSRRATSILLLSLPGLWCGTQSTCSLKEGSTSHIWDTFSLNRLSISAPEFEFSSFYILIERRWWKFQIFITLQRRIDKEKQLHSHLALVTLEFEKDGSFNQRIIWVSNEETSSGKSQFTNKWLVCSLWLERHWQLQFWFLVSNISPLWNTYICLINGFCPLIKFKLYSFVVFIFLCGPSI